jgi:RNA polymerase sigma factor (sigma-70 family)
MLETLHETTPFKKLTENEVVAGLKVSENEKELKFFQYEFYNRFAPYIYKVGCQKCRNFQDSEMMAREILQLTFIKAYKSIGRFTFPEGVEPGKCKLIIKAWLGKIANNEFLKEIGKRVNETIDFDSLGIPEPSYDPFAVLLNDNPVEVPNEFRMKLQEAMNELSEQDKHIILTYAGEGCINSTKHLSSAAMNYLCEHYQTTSEAIRQRKKRALDKIKSICFK